MFIMNILLNKRMARRLLLFVFLLLSSFSILCAQEYQHTLLKPYGFDMLANRDEILDFLSDFEIETQVHYDPEIYLATIEPGNQSILEDLNLDYDVVLFKDEVMAIGLFQKDISYRNFLIKRYGEGERINRNDSKNELQWHINQYMVRVITDNGLDFHYEIRSIDVDKKYDLFLEERAKTDPYF